jgi:hypothetical protein
MRRVAASEEKFRKQFAEEGFDSEAGTHASEGASFGKTEDGVSSYGKLSDGRASQLTGTRHTVAERVSAYVAASAPCTALNSVRVPLMIRAAKLRFEPHAPVIVKVSPLLVCEAADIRSRRHPPSGDYGSRQGW